MHAYVLIVNYVGPKVAVLLDPICVTAISCVAEVHKRVTSWNWDAITATECNFFAPLGFSEPISETGVSPVQKS